jgi:hypothetical protein
MKVARSSSLALASRYSSRVEMRLENYFNGPGGGGGGRILRKKEKMKGLEKNNWQTRDQPV